MSKNLSQTKFDWDKGNLKKNQEKHGITARESEEVFFDEKSIIIKDIKHSQKESRFINIGKTFTEEVLFVIFTLRKDSIRIISARKANKKEKNIYKRSI